jgi:phosphoribosylformylglycinamidine cyclo-ligase
MASYRAAGVDLAAADRHVDAIADLVTATWGPGVVGGFGGFAGGIELPPGYRHPVLMLSTDGVGTKLELARRTGRWGGVGHDLVAMCVDDLAATGATPLGLVDYMAVGRLDPERDQAVVASVASGCALAAVPLLGGETAEHPGVMPPDQVDLAGAALAVVERDVRIDGSDIRAGDLIVGVASHNLRSNGFSLVRAIVGERDLDEPFPEDSRTWGEVLLDPSVIYTPAVLDAVAGGGVRGLAHVTGGGIAANLARILPERTGAVIRSVAWEVPPVFHVLQELGGVPEDEMRSAFNMGLGYLAVVDPGAEGLVRESFARFGHATWVIGEVLPGARGIEFTDSA